MNSLTQSLSAALANLDKATDDSNAVIKPDGTSITFDRLSSRVRGIQALFPIARPRVVGIMLDRSSMLEAVLAVLRAGASVVLLNPVVAPCYLEGAARRAGVDFVITRAGQGRKCPGTLQLHLPSHIDEATASPVIVEVDDSNPAIINGQRIVTRRYILDVAAELAMHAGHPMSNVVLPAYGLPDCDFVSDSVASLLAGYTLAIMPYTKQDSVSKTMAYAEAERVTVITARPFFRTEIERRKMSVPPSLRHIIDRISV